MDEPASKKLIRLNARTLWLQTDFDVELNQTIMDYGARISHLLLEPHLQDMPSAIGVLDDLLGAVYSLILAKHHGFKDRTSDKIEIGAVKTRANQIRNGEVRIDGTWIAGWHFNSALFRIAAVYHRLLKVIDNTPPETHVYIKDLLLRIEPQYRLWKGYDWSKESTQLINTEVNYLKHRAKGLHEFRIVEFVDGIGGIAELLNLFEAWNSTFSEAETD